MPKAVDASVKARTNELSMLIIPYFTVVKCKITVVVCVFPEAHLYDINKTALSGIKVGKLVTNKSNKNKQQQESGLVNKEVVDREMQK